ncbi:MAG: endonuclease/exonuclease/phosphatase family protein, partial [Bdellovibrionales bacterium]|nr:endonuclease/exonuclease/phosphatase family protein [Bdellovibrionales bacterium]
LKKFGMQFISTPFQSAIRPANTGMNAKKLPDGSYTTNTNHPDWLKLADHDNFGLFPAEYSSGLISKFPILNLNVISDLKWKDFDPSFDPAAFKDARGLPYRRDLELFDKNFMDVTIVIGATPVHVIILHTVPAFNFGNPNGLNELRNAAQLRFLKYYLTGVVSKTDQPIVKSLNPGEAFIAMGDWNVDRDNSELEGAVVLKELGALFQYWIKDRVITYESQNYSPDRFSSQLDYILLSPHFDIVDSGVFRNENRIEKGCDGEPNDQKEGWKVVSYPSGEKTCYALVPDEMVLSKTASDHFAIFAEVTLKP